MADEWKHIPLGDFVTLQRGHDLPDERRRFGRVPVLGSFGITGWHDTAKARGPGVTVGRSGASFGVVSYSSCDYWPLNTALYVIDFHGNDERFAYYLLRNFDFKSYNSGSAQPSLNRNFIHPVLVDVPSIVEQRAIARILGTLDDKIELNRRMSETLEAMARTLFKSWFVDFDPVRAKMEGRDPGLPKEIADLFPSRMVESEIGEIPEGWVIQKLGDLLELAYGRALRAESRRLGAIPVYGSRGQVGWHDERLVEGPGIVVGRKGNPGVVTWVPKDFFPIDTTFFVIPKLNPSWIEFFYFALMGHDLASLGADSAVPGLNRNLAYMNDQVVPPEPLVKRFERVAGGLLNRAHSLAGETATIVGLRDTLLPKLMTGQLRVVNAERTVDDEQ